MEKKIIEVLKNLGVPMGNLGFKYIKDAVKLAAEDEEILTNMTKPGGLYATVAKMHNSTASRVERAIRHGIECSFSHCDVDTIKGYFGNVSGNKLTNRNFIAALACEVRE